MSTIADAVRMVDVANARASQTISDFGGSITLLRKIMAEVPADEASELLVTEHDCTSLLASIDSLFGNLVVPKAKLDYLSEELEAGWYSGVITSRRVADDRDEYTLSFTLDDYEDAYTSIVAKGSVLPPGGPSSADALLGRRVKVRLGGYRWSDSYERIAEEMELLPELGSAQAPVQEGYLPMLPIDQYGRGVLNSRMEADNPFDARVLRYFEADGLPYLDLAPEYSRKTGDPQVVEACAIGIDDPGQLVGQMVDVTLGGHVHETTENRVINSIEPI